MTADPRVPLYERLPEIYRVRDAEQSPPDQLRAYLGAIESTFGALHDNIGQLYDDLFIDTCDDWVVPYIADLLGTTHLKGEPRTLRADVADTIALRRRKGTLGAIERLAVNLTGWACRGVEMRENLGWHQHLNHQRPDAGGAPPYAAPTINRFHTRRGGTVPLRDPAALALLGTPFDDFAYSADTKPALDDARHVNLPNLAIFLWRLVAYRLRLTTPLAKGFTDLGVAPAGLARFAVHFDLDALDRPVRLFNTSRPGFQRPDTSGGVVSPLTEVDAVPGPIYDVRLNSDAPAGRPDAYVALDFFDDAPLPPNGFDLSDVGLHFFLPLSEQPVFATTEWIYRGDNLCAWEAGLRQPLRDGEIVIDPDIGRVVFGVGNSAQRDALIAPEGAGFVPRIFASYTYAAPGPAGAHPITRAADETDGFELRSASEMGGGTSLQSQLDNLDSATQDVVIEVSDSLVHRVDLSAVPGSAVDGGNALRLAFSLTIRAADGHRPTIVLTQPLAFRPVVAADATVTSPMVRLEGLFLTADAGSFPADEALINRVALARLELIGCTLDPGGHRRRDGSRAPMQRGLSMANGYGFVSESDSDDFVPTPDIVIQRCICGAIAIDDRYRLDIEASIVDARLGVNDDASDLFENEEADDANGAFAIAAATDPTTAWAAPLDFRGLTCFGPVRVTEVGGSGGLFTQRFEVLDNQHGCIKWSWFSGDADRLPPNHFCVGAPDARLIFTSEFFNDPGYAQLARGSDKRVRTVGPGDDAMGAFGFTLEAHKWTNLQVRLREFMPVGVRPLIVPVT